MSDDKTALMTWSVEWLSVMVYSMQMANLMITLCVIYF